MPAVLLVGAGAPLAAQTEPAKPVIPLKITITISRYQGERRTSSFPYTLSMSLDPGVRNGQAIATRRVGIKVPVTTASAPQPGGTPVPKIEYQDVGTQIDCVGKAAGDGRFKLDVTIDDSTVVDDTPQSKTNAQIGRPTFRSFRTSESIMLRDGESGELSRTPDPMTGDVVRVDVALNVVK
jgi:hypothetical protein